MKALASWLDASLTSRSACQKSTLMTFTPLPLAIDLARLLILSKFGKLEVRKRRCRRCRRCRRRCCARSTELETRVSSGGGVGRFVFSVLRQILVKKVFK